MITMGTACSGIGGAEVAALIAGLPIRSQWAIEIGKHQAAILEARLGVTVYGDAYACGRDNLAPVDLFCAGFPCQPFSVAGRRGGAKDPRNLWPEIARITEEIGPRAVIFENVPALRNPHPAGAVVDDDADAGEETPDALPGYLGTVLGDLVDLGYHVAWDGRSASSMGAHHRRDRVWIVGWKAGEVADFDPFRPEDRAVDARLVGVWTGERWERPGLFGGDPVMKWPRAGIVRGLEAYEVGTSSDANARAISWPTPIWQTLWATAAARDWKDSGEGTDYAAIAAKSRLSGEVHAALLNHWNTPRATDAKGSGPLGSSSQRSRLDHQQLDAQAIEATHRSGLLNPRWVEALMGYPPGWTDITITNPEDLIAPWEVADAWGRDCYRVGDIEGTNPEYAGYWLWHESLGPLALPTAPRDAQTKNRLVSLGNAWVPQVAAPIMARIVEALDG